MWELIRAPAGVADGLRSKGLSPAALSELVVGDAQLDAVGRLDIYADMYFWRLHDLLLEEFVALGTVLGAAAFRNLITDYLLACPSAQPSVRNVGQRLPAFLADHPLGLERPFLAELARLERTRRELFDGPDAQPLTLDHLQGLESAAFVALPLVLVPSHARFEVTYAVDELWRTVMAGEEFDDPAPAPRTLLVWRQEVEVYHRGLLPLERDALDHIGAGTTFGEICELVAARLPLAEAGPAAFGLLARWAADGIIARP